MKTSIFAFAALGLLGLATPGHAQNAPNQGVNGCGHTATATGQGATLTVDQNTGVLCGTGGGNSGTAPAQSVTPANASHTPGQSVGGLFAVPVARGPGGSGDILYISVMSQAGDTTALLARAWDRKPTSTSPQFACNDNSAYVAGSAADDSHLIGGVPFTLTPTISTPSTGDAKTYANFGFVPPASFDNQDIPATKFIYVCLVATATYTPGVGVYYVNASAVQD